MIELSLGESTRIESNEAAPDLIADMDTASSISHDSLIGALGRKHESNLGSIPGVRITGAREHIISKTVELLGKAEDSRATDQPLSSHATTAIRKRRDRSAQEVSEALASQFGYKLDSPINYIQGVGVSGRIRLAEYKNQDVPDDIFQIVDPYVDNPSTSFGDAPGSASLAGAVWADDLFRVTKDPRYKNYLLDLANRFDSSGPNPPAPSDPKWRTEDMFMLGSMMGRSYTLTQEGQYLDLLTNFLVEMGTPTDFRTVLARSRNPLLLGQGQRIRCVRAAETLTYLPQSIPYTPIYF